MTSLHFPRAKRHRTHSSSSEPLFHMEETQESPGYFQALYSVRQPHTFHELWQLIEELRDHLVEEHDLEEEDKIHFGFGNHHNVWNSTSLLYLREQAVEAILNRIERNMMPSSSSAFNLTKIKVHIVQNSMGGCTVHPY